MEEEQREEIEGLQCVLADDLELVSDTVPLKVKVKVQGATLYLTMPGGYPEGEALVVSVSQTGTRGKKMADELNDLAECNLGGACAMSVVDRYQELLEVEKLKAAGDTQKEHGSDSGEESSEPTYSHGGWIASTADGAVKIAVDVRPGRPKTEITNFTDIRRSKAGSLEMDVSAPARLGAANAELFKFLSRRLKISRDDISFASSRKTRAKCLSLSGISVDEIVSRMKEE